MALPTVSRGSRDAYGSWKTICISCRNGWRFLRDIPTSSVPLYFTDPAVGVRSCRTHRATVDLPEPLSPTRPNVWPLGMEKLTLDTACTTALMTLAPCSDLIGKTLTRSTTSSAGTLPARSPFNCGATAFTRRLLGGAVPRREHTRSPGRGVDRARGCRRRRPRGRTGNAAGTHSPTAVASCWAAPRESASTAHVPAP